MNIWQFVGPCYSSYLEEVHWVKPLSGIQLYACIITWLYDSVVQLEQFCLIHEPASHLGWLCSTDVHSGTQADGAAASHGMFFSWQWQQHRGQGPLYRLILSLWSCHCCWYPIGQSKSHGQAHHGKKRKAKFGEQKAINSHTCCILHLPLQKLKREDNSSMALALSWPLGNSERIIQRSRNNEWEIIQSAMVQSNNKGSHVINSFLTRLFPRQGPWLCSPLVLLVFWAQFYSLPDDFCIDPVNCFLW